MKVNVTICLDVELVNQLQGVNKSSLINELLIDYFTKSKSVDKLLIEKKELLSNVVNEVNELEINRKEEEHKKGEADKKSHEEDNSEERWKKIEDMQRETFFNKKWDFGSLNRETMFKEFISMLRNNQVQNMINYFEFKGITERNGI